MPANLFSASPRISRLTGLLATVFLSAASGLTAQTLDWDPDPAAGIQGGAGTWDSTATNFTGDGGTTNAAWPNDTATVAQFTSPAGSVTLGSTLGSGGITVNDSGYDFLMNVTQADKLELYGDFTGGADVKFANSKINRYEPALLGAGVHFYGGSTIEAEVNFTLTELQSSPILGAHGAGTVVNYRGNFFGNGGQSIPSVVTQTGGKVVLTQDAFVELILSGSAFTRQLWVYGDGTGTLELEEGFVADSSGGITVAPDGTPVINNIVHTGLGSIRQSNNTIITHHTQNLPVGLRPDGSGGYQINGHFVFEDAGGSAWQTRTNPQTYIGAVWIGVDMTIDTDVDTTHAGITTFSSWNGSYWADNAFQTTAENVTITKTGAADLIFAEETAFLPGTVMSVDEGGVVFKKDPAAGSRKGSNNGVEGGPNLQLVVGKTGVDGRDASVRFEGPLSRIAAINSTQGRIEVLGEVRMDSYSSNSQKDLPNNIPPPSSATLPTTLNFHLDTAHGQIVVAGDAALGGELLFTREPGFEPPVGTSFDVLTAGSFSVGPNNSSATFESVQDRSDLGLELEYLPDRIRVTTTREASSTAMIIDEDWTDGAFDASGWQLINSKADFRGTGRTDPAMALTQRLADPGFVWPVYELEVPGFYVADDNVLVIRMTTFSDVAYTNQELAKPEVACLNDNPLADFGHDHATELSRKYYRNNNSFQMNPSVENDDNKQFPGVHHSGGSTPTTLENAEESLNLFRPTATGANSEGFGEIGRAEINHTRYLQHFNNILISLPREYFPDKSPVFRTGTDQSTGQIGMSQAHVGVTKRTDANLDYATDAIDFIYWNSYNGNGSGMHLQWGDFDNDGATDGDDYALWETYRGQEHDPAFNTPQTKYAVADLPGAGTAPTFTYDSATGEMTITTNGTAVSAWAVEGPAALVVSSLGTSWWQSYTASKEQAADGSLAGLSGSEVLIASYAAGLDSGDFGTVTFGYASGGGGQATLQLVNVPYQNWADTYGLTGPDRYPSASPAEDGIPNIVKYGLGNDPTIQGGGLPPIVILDIDGSDYFAVRFTRPSGQADLTTEGEISNNLQNWSSDPADVELTVQDNGNGTETVTIRAVTPMSEAASQHLRALFSL